MPKDRARAGTSMYGCPIRLQGPVAVATAGGFLAWMEVLRWLPAGTASLNMFAIPVIALLSSMAVFGERLAANEWVGIALIGGGLCLVTAQALAGGRRGALLPADPTPLDGG